MANFDKDDLNDKLGLMRREAEEREAERYAAACGLPYLNVLPAIQLEALKLLSETEAREGGIAPVKVLKKEATVLLSDPNNAKTASAIDKLKGSGYQITPSVVSLTNLNKAFERYAEVVITPTEITSRIEISESEFNDLMGKVKNLADAQNYFTADIPKLSTTKVLAGIFGSSILIDASDIHFETTKDDIHLRFRIDGTLHDVFKFTHAVYKQILNRAKLLSGLKINIADSPQDGRFTIKIGATEIKPRVSIIPSEFGEAIVMRVLNPKSISLTLTQLGLRADNESIALEQIKKPNGMILVTGPTGSGKTTTLYAFLKTVNDPESKIITIEDPIEYHLAGIQQTQSDAKAGYTFASGLRSILRQDPDMILVGEIRALETAEIAIRASLTGHLVFSTLHTNNAIGAVPRLIDLGIKPSILGPALSLVIAQRLVRKLCLNCRKPVIITPGLKSKILKLKAKLSKKVKLYSTEEIIYEASGCEKCNGGYKGRVGIYEFLEFGGEFESLINKDASEFAIKQFAQKKGLVEMQIDGVLKVLAGITSFDEVEKVTGSINW